MGELNGRRRWGNNIQVDLQKLAVTNWKESTSDRDEWSLVVYIAKNLKISEC